MPYILLKTINLIGITRLVSLLKDERTTMLKQIILQQECTYFGGFIAVTWVYFV